MKKLLLVTALFTATQVVQAYKPGQNGGGDEHVVVLKGKSLAQRQNERRADCFKHNKAYVVRKGEVGHCSAMAAHDKNQHHRAKYPRSHSRQSPAQKE